MPNQFGGREDLDAVSFLKELNEVIYGREPGIISAAEESTAWPGVSRPTYLGGLGFGFKWNMGWMHDTLGYFQQDPIYRRYHHHELTFSLMYAFSENFILPLSHDEVVHGKGSLYAKMAGGDNWQKLANLRALYAYMWAHPGKKLLFMGSELAQEAEWSYERSLDWHLLEQPDARRRPGARPRPQPPLQATSRRCGSSIRDPTGFWWLEPNDADSNVLAFARASKDGERVVVFVANLSPVPREGYRLGLPAGRAAGGRRSTPTRGTTAAATSGNLGGIEPEPIPWHSQPVSALVTLPPLAAVWLVPEPSELDDVRAGRGRRRRVPVGASARRPPARGRQRRVPRLGAARAVDLAPPRRARRRARKTPATGSTSESRRRAPATTTGSSLDGRPAPRSVLALAARGPARPSRMLDAARRLAPFDAVRRMRELVIYELHVGTFTPEGTFEAAIPHLRELAELGVTAIEIMPVAEFPGDRGWGYDGVYISAAHSAYGGPHGLARFVDAAHDAGLAVILDVVYNHVGASGTQALEAFGPYFTDRYATPWGKAINYDDADCDPVREWVLQSAVGWVRDFGIDGLRLDAIHAIFDASAEHIVAAVARRVHAYAARCAGDRRERAQRSAGDARPRRRRLGLRRAVGRRLPPRAAHAR